MRDALRLIPPQCPPPLDAGFRPAVLANRAFQSELGSVGEPLIIGLERENQAFSRYETMVFPESHPRAAANLPYVERIVKFLLWQRGGFRIYLGGSASIAAALQKMYSPDGERKFDYHFFSDQVYEQPLRIVACQPAEVPPVRETGAPLGRHLDGCRIGFDLGASDRKVSAVVDGKAVYSEEVIWEPRKHSDPDYHYREITQALRTAASKMPRVDAIGGSSAGIYIDNRPMVASLFRNVPPENYPEIRGSVPAHPRRVEGAAGSDQRRRRDRAGGIDVAGRYREFSGLPSAPARRRGTWIWTARFWAG